MRASHFVACVCAVLFQQESFGQPDVVLVNSTPDRFSIQVIGGSNSLSIARFSYSGHSIGLESVTADLQYYQIVNYGEVFNPLDSRVFGGLASDGLGEVGTGDFYLGIWLPIGGFQTFQNHRQFYGWAHLQPVNGVLAMRGSAMSQSYGIIVGTTQVVPEPTSAALLLGMATMIFSVIGTPRESIFVRRSRNLSGIS